MTYPEGSVYRYSVSEDGKSIDVEHAGHAEMNDGDGSHEEKAKALIVSTQRIPEDSFKVKRVDSIQDGVITSNETTNKN
jgi:hypothetical protein